MAQFKGDTYKLTKVFVEGLPLSGRDKKGRVEQRFYWDSRDRGFGVCVGLNAKTFVVQREIDGRTVREKIGRFGPLDWTVDQARKEAQQRLSALARGERQPKALAITLKEAWERYRDLLRAQEQDGDRSAKTISVYKYNVEKYLHDWQSRALATISRDEVRELHKKLTADPGKPTADLVTKIFRATYNDALDTHDLPANPVTKKFAKLMLRKAKPKRTAIPAEKLPAWHAAVNGLGNAVHRDALLFLLFSGMRKTSVMEMRCEDIDLDSSVLHVPTPKGGPKAAFDLPLSRFLCDVLRRREAERASYAAEAKCAPWVFPSASSGTGHLEKLPVPEVADLKWVVHDLRRTFVTTAESLGVSPYAIKCIVNHAQPESDQTAKYMNLTTERLATDMERIGAAIAAASAARSAKVVPIRQRRARA